MERTNGEPPRAKRRQLGDLNISGIIRRFQVSSGPGTHAAVQPQASGARMCLSDTSCPPRLFPKFLRAMEI
ncbi:hypothetical protein E2C01_054921 [Portunus trituberculatus]|uniref:Uncharacterized protein n=1 Tax=Portunus trituberculatus TaxID=210409 RepID=A0A5B7GPW0_PORTR|nr:hypothetical protein [Portunus trituberculatus]